MHDKPTAEHKWLEKLLGEWTFEHRGPGGPGEPEKVFGGGKETFRSLNGMWFVGESTMPMPDEIGGEGQMVITLGYDIAKKTYVGSWVGSMMSRMWTYEGTIDPTGRILTLESEGPVFEDPSKTTLYRDIIEFTATGDRLFRSTMQGPDGNWVTFMSATYKRMK